MPVFIHSLLWNYIFSRFFFSLSIICELDTCRPTNAIAAPVLPDIYPMFLTLKLIKLLWLGVDSATELVLVHHHLTESIEIQISYSTFPYILSTFSCLLADFFRHSLLFSAIVIWLVGPTSMPPTVIYLALRCSIMKLCFIVFRTHTFE